MRFISLSLLSYLFLTFTTPCYPIGKLTLSEAINIHVYHTRFVKIQQLAYENALMEYDNYRKSHLPSFSFNTTPISFNHSMRLLQNYNTGEYINVEEFSNTASLGMSISQKIAATGGSLTFGSNMNFLREFTNSSNSFSSTPLYFSYSQSLFGGGKSERYESSIHNLRIRMALRNYCSSVSSEQQKVLALYLDAYSNKMDIDFYTKNVNIGDSLLYYANIRKSIGKITEFEYNQIELQHLGNKIELGKAQNAYLSSLRLLSNELSIQNIDVCEISIKGIPLYLDEESVLEFVRKNNPEYQLLELERVNAEYALHQARTNNRFNANVSLSYGLNQYARTFKDAYTRPNQKQTASLTFSIPIFQWGINRNRLKMSRNEYETTLMEQEMTLDHFHEEAKGYIQSFNTSRKLSELADKKYALSSMQYSHAAMRYNLGKIAAIELNQAGKEYLQAKMDHMSTLKGLLINYYKIRHLTLHDFVENKDLTELITKH